MKFVVKVMVLCFCIMSFVFMPVKAFCEEEHHITLLSGLSKPPFIIAEDDKGMQIEIIQTALAKNNYQISFIYLPMTRQMEVYKKRNIEGLITLSETENELGLYLSKPYISYENVVISLASNNFNISEVSDLSGMRVAAFQNATKLLGEKYNKIFKGSNSYIELEDQKSQIVLLFTNKVDALVTDINIFKQFLTLKKNEKLGLPLYNQKYVVHKLFGKINYVAGFNSEQLQNDFDKGIAEIKMNGNYQKIIDSYLEIKKK